MPSVFIAMLFAIMKPENNLGLSIGDDDVPTQWDILQ